VHFNIGSRLRTVPASQTGPKISEKEPLVRVRYETEWFEREAEEQIVYIVEIRSPVL